MKYKHEKKKKKTKTITNPFLDVKLKQMYSKHIQQQLQLNVCIYGNRNLNNVILFKYKQQQQQKLSKLFNTINQ